MGVQKMPLIGERHAAHWFAWNTRDCSIHNCHAGQLYFFLSLEITCTRDCPCCLQLLRLQTIIHCSDGSVPTEWTAEGISIHRLQMAYHRISHHATAVYTLRWQQRVPL